MSERGKYDREDLDDIIGLAARHKDRDEESLSVAEIEEVAEDLGSPAEYVEGAITELERRREQQSRDEAARKRKQTTALWVSAGVAVCVGFLALTSMWSAQSTLEGLNATAEQKRSQVQNVVERQTRTQAQWSGQADSSEKMAELSGAENRVRIEARRYDEAAAAYNTSARSFPNSVWTGVLGLPAELPLSTEIETW